MIPISKLNLRLRAPLVVQSRMLVPCEHSVGARVFCACDWLYSI